QRQELRVGQALQGLERDLAARKEPIANAVDDSHAAGPKNLHDLIPTVDELADPEARQFRRRFAAEHHRIADRVPEIVVQRLDAARSHRPPTPGDSSYDTPE